MAKQLPKTRARRDLEQWIDLELTFYVRELINGGDLVTLRRNLLNIAEAHAQRMVRAARRKPSVPALLRSWICPRCSTRNEAGIDNCLACGLEHTR